MRTSPFLIIVALFLMTLTGEAQEKKPAPSPTPPETEEVVRITTELVQTDVTVFDKGGHFVSGLKPEQFELRVDGKPQPITFFESIVTGGRSESAAFRSLGGKKPPVQPVVEDPNESVVGRTIIFFVNDLHLEPGSIARTHKMITGFVEHMLGPHDQVAITSASGQIGFLQQLTDNKAVLREAISRLNAKYNPETTASKVSISEVDATLVANHGDRGLFSYLLEATMKEFQTNGI